MIRRWTQMVDREWIRVGWVGSQTVRHRLLAFLPLLVIALVAPLFAYFGYEVAKGMILLGVAKSGLLTLWIEGRRMAALRNARRSERVFRASSGG